MSAWAVGECRKRVGRAPSSRRGAVVGSVSDDASLVGQHRPRADVVIAGEVGCTLVAAAGGVAADAPQRQQGVRESDFDGWRLPTATAAT